MEILIPVGAETLTVFSIAALALTIAPGPDNLFVLIQSAIYGRVAGFFVTMGLCTGLLFHTTAVAVGVATLIATSTTAFIFLKVVGAVYLLYLAWKAFRAGTTGVENETNTATTNFMLYRRGIIMNIANPKVAIFFLAFFPQFIDPAQGAVTSQIMTLGAVFILITVVVFCGIAWFSGFLGENLANSPRAQKILNRVASVVFIGLAIRLLATEQTS